MTPRAAAMLVGSAAFAAVAGLAVLVLAFQSATPTPTSGPIPFDATTNSPAFCQAVKDAIAREDFDSLEATARTARSLQLRYPGGVAELQVFYESFGPRTCSDDSGAIPDSAVKARVDFLDRWLARKSDPLTAAIAMAEFWEQYAWIGRGNGFSNAISPDQWRLFGERARKSAEYMRAVDPSQDAEAYLVLLDLARDLNVPRPQIDALFLAAHRAFPSYLSYYSSYVTLLEPKWFGRPGEVIPYIRSLLTDPGGDAGLAAYSRVAVRLAWELQSSDIYRLSGLEWRDVQHGFEVREKLYGLDPLSRITLCYYAVAAGDRVAARAAFRNITRLESWPIGGMRDFYLTVLPWIMARG